MRPLHGQPIIEQRYTIHRSRASVEGISVIKQTLVLGDGKRLTAVQYTKAINADDRFALIFSRRFPALNLAKYSAVESVTQKISLGAYDYSMYSLFVSVFVGAENCPFPNGNGKTFSVLQFPFNGLKLVLLWGFIFPPAGGEGLHSHFLTLAPEQSPVPLSHNNTSLNVAQMITAFRAQRAMALADSIRKLPPDIPQETVEGMNMFKGYFRSGLASSLEWQEHLQDVREPEVRLYEGAPRITEKEQ